MSFSRDQLKNLARVKMNTYIFTTRWYPQGIQRLISKHQSTAQSSMRNSNSWGGGGILGKLRTKVPKYSMGT